MFEIDKKKAVSEYGFWNTKKWAAFLEVKGSGYPNSS